MRINRLLSIIMVACVALSVMACAHAQKNDANMNKETKTLVAYFSATGTTMEAATRLAQIAGADLHEIVPETRYTPADLNWHDKNSRSSVEMADKSSRPAVTGRVENMAQYDTVFVGFPIWWYIAPTIVNTFLEQYDLKGKTIVPFFTSGGSDAGETLNYLKPSAPNAVWVAPKNFNYLTDEDIKAWVDSLRP